MITSLQNPRIKNLVRLRNRRDRDQQQKMIVEGYRAIRRAAENNIRLDALYMCRDYFLGANEDDLINEISAKGVAVWEVAPTVFRKISYRDRPEGLLAVGPQFHHELDEIKASETAFFIIVEATEKPGNLGSILRSADAAGVDGVIVCDGCTDLFNPNVICASVGALFTVFTAEASSPSMIAWCHDQAIHIVAATPNAERTFTQVDLPRRLAIVVGTEQYGLSDIWSEQADLQVRIPMFGQVNSLNVATAATLLLYEATRQHQGH